jgi:antitoxin MazE
MQLFKWKGGLAVRIPAAVVEALKLREGDEVRLCIARESKCVTDKRVAAASALARLRKFRGRLPADFTFSRDEANTRG